MKYWVLLLLIAFLVQTKSLFSMQSCAGVDCPQELIVVIASLLFDVHNPHFYKRFENFRNFAAVNQNINNILKKNIKIIFENLLPHHKNPFILARNMKITLPVALKAAYRQEALMRAINDFGIEQDKEKNLYDAHGKLNKFISEAVFLFRLLSELESTKLNKILYSLVTTREKLPLNNTIIQILLDLGADPDHEDSLCCSISNENDDVMKMLLDAGANPNKGKVNARPLWHAFKHDNPSARNGTIRLLLESGASVHFTVQDYELEQYCTEGCIPETGLVTVDRSFLYKVWEKDDKDLYKIIWQQTGNDVTEMFGWRALLKKYFYCLSCQSTLMSDEII